MTTSLSFDRAADYYDATRALPEQIARGQTDALLRELERAEADRLLEVGIGTGRISRPLLERGVRVTGVDISPRMLERLRAQVGPSMAPVDVALADATLLPLEAASHRAVLVVHVLHLVSDWRRTLDEIRRVLAKDGLFIHDVTHYSQNNPWQQVFAKRTELLAALGFVPRERPSDEEIAFYIESLGGTSRRVNYGARNVHEVADEVVDRARRRIDSWTWEIPEEIFPTFMSQYEEHARRTLGNLAATNTTHIKHGIDVWSFDGA